MTFINTTAQIPTWKRKACGDRAEKKPLLKYKSSNHKLLNPTNNG